MDCGFCWISPAPAGSQRFTYNCCNQNQAKEAARQEAAASMVKILLLLCDQVKLKSNADAACDVQTGMRLPTSMQSLRSLVLA